MELGPNAKREHREITYQVGWKKGKIKLQTVQEEPAPEELTTSAAPKSFWSLLHTYAWKEALIAPQACLYGALWALPVLSFLLTLGLVYKLTH